MARRDLRQWWRAAPSVVVAVSLIGVDVRDCAAQSARKRFGSPPTPVRQATPVPNGFAATIDRLLADARRQAAEGHIDESIRTAQRARKIAEASSAVLRDNPAVSTAAADELLQELQILRDAMAAPKVAAVQPVQAPVTVPVPVSVSAPVPMIAPPSMIRPEVTVAPVAPPVAVPDSPRPVALAAEVERPSAVEPNVDTLTARQPTAQLLASARTQPPTVTSRPPSIQANRTLSEPMFSADGFSIVGGQPSASATEPESEAVPQFEIVLGPAVLYPPRSVELGRNVLATGRTRPLLVREYRTGRAQPEVTPTTSDPVVPGRPDLRFEDAVITAEVAEPKATESSQGEIPIMTANRALPLVAQEDRHAASEDDTPVTTDVVADHTAVEPLPRQDVVPTEWSSTEPVRGVQGHRQTGVIDTAWESAASHKAEPLPPPLIPKKTAAEATPRSEPKSPGVTQAAFADSAMTATVEPLIAPPPPREIEEAPTSESVRALDDAELLAPMTWVREQSGVASQRASRPNWSPSLIDQVSRGTALPAQTVTAGLAAVGLLLLGAGLTLLRFALRRNL